MYKNLKKGSEKVVYSLSGWPPPSYTPT